MQAHIEVNAPEVDEGFAEQFIRDEIINWITGAQGVVDLAFVSHGYPNPWAPLKPSTIKDKTRKGYSSQADQTRTGKLQADAKNPAIEAGDGRVEFTIPAAQNPYAGAHQYGVSHILGGKMTTPSAKAKAAAMRRSGMRGSGVRAIGIMPPRPPLPLPSEEWCARFGQELVDKLLKLEGF